MQAEWLNHEDYAGEIRKLELAYKLSKDLYKKRIIAQLKNFTLHNNNQARRFLHIGVLILRVDHQEKNTINFNLQNVQKKSEN